MSAVYKEAPGTVLGAAGGAGTGRGDVPVTGLNEHKAKGQLWSGKSERAMTPEYPAQNASLTPKSEGDRDCSSEGSHLQHPLLAARV
eukprot:XP_013962865.1 uncharacterized protein LOC102155055 isoform X2 [Canis lupus familiaris]